ncbi:tRNA (guanine(26)-N(2))-dimethyltransferase [Thermoplasma sp.]|uniref:tRNA (guanine(26)-N(2))-dimethyltransferase n=1 Tax=Thermoplasma sp. TaxID=1973142 RepID=UPI0012758C73|nr:tRNA (guanine-N2)-dimethyltransferase [Thermoplasma sp.]KAA8923042.1 MAG: tRNA (guanine-N2)-dimethyltransferase [Thermoplasma sp.]
MIVNEGSAEIIVPEVYHGPGKRGTGFYNADQKINRDITIEFIKRMGVHTVLDGFGGTGIRGIRISKETGSSVTIAEVSRESYRLIMQNVERNGSQATVVNDSFECVLQHGVFEYVDIDPYGSPAPYLDAALLGVKRNGYLGITATDQSALTGSVPHKTRVRYEAVINNDTFRHEMGVRLLIGYVARRAASLGRWIEPMMSIWHGHYYRVFVRVMKGFEGAGRMMRNMGYVNKHTLLWDMYPDMDEGPVWKGNIQDDAVAKDVLGSAGHMNFNSEENRLLFCDMTDIARIRHTSLPPVETVLQSLVSYGHAASRTMFSPTGIKTDASCTTLEGIMMDALRRRSPA